MDIENQSTNSPPEMDVKQRLIFISLQIENLTYEIKMSVFVITFLLFWILGNTS